MIDLNELEERVDKSLSSETKESLTNFLEGQRIKQQEITLYISFPNTDFNILRSLGLKPNIIKKIKMIIESVNVLYFYEIIDDEQLSEIKYNIEKEINQQNLNNIKLK